jgi:hypothetical protein
MFKYWGSETQYQILRDRIQSDPLREVILDSRLDVRGMDIQREEPFISKLPSRVPILRHLYRATNRAYSGFLMDMRYQTFKDIYRSAERHGVKTDDPKFVASLGKYVNSATGRGTIKHFEDASEFLNGVLFSPRLMASRLNLLNPVYYAKLEPFVRKQALKDLLAFGGTAITMATLAGMAGANVAKDPRNADFGKYRIGNTRYDPYGGFQQYIVLAARLITGKMVSSTTGKVTVLGEGYKPTTRADIALRFFESKSSPVASFFAQWMRGRDFAGQPFNIPEEVKRRFIPMVIQDLQDLVKDEGWEGAGMVTPAIFGVGVQTYTGHVPTAKPAPSRTTLPPRRHVRERGLPE